MGLANLNLQSLIGGSVADASAKVVGVYKVDPTAKLNAETELQKIHLELQGWLPRNVRPLLLLLWGLLITFNYLLPLLAHFVSAFQSMQPLVLPDWLYKLTAIGFTGYVTARTWEKVTNSDQ